MSEALTSSGTPGAAELMSLDWSSTVPISKRASNGSHQAKHTLLMLTFGNAYFQAAITKIYQ